SPGCCPSGRVHFLSAGRRDGEGGAAPRRNQLVFIGRNLDGQSMREEFEACLI
ncbi:MAG: GTP-binding protein, partial [Chloroflexi bacterium]|nr:GTP-binding protein [Chloroflexota bacterium]